MFSGGYIGVDVFFVLSGFLVTQLLLRDVARSGSIRFGRFYARRFRRLLPAAFVALIVTAVVFTAIASPAEVLDAAGSFKAAFLYVTNWYFIHHATGYFGANITTNPVLHFWSLAVEEQFYLLWPLTLGGIFLVTRRLDPDASSECIRIAVARRRDRVGRMGALAPHTRTRTTPTTAPTPAPTSCSRARCSRSLRVFARAKRNQRSVRVGDGRRRRSRLIVRGNVVGPSRRDRARRRGHARHRRATRRDRERPAEARQPGAVEQHRRVPREGLVRHLPVALARDPRAVRTFQPSPTATIAIAALVATGLASLSFQVLERPVRTSSSSTATAAS